MLSEESHTGRSVIVRSAAKINPFLEVTGRRSDGFHELETVMLRTDLCDVMQFTVRRDGRIELSCVADGTATSHSRPPAPVDGNFPVDGTNLIARAAVALQQRTETSLGVSVVIHKQIPMESGLGGGSGNAAVTLRTLNQLWDLQLPERDLHNIAASLGSDVNFLLSGRRAAICSGRGEQIEGIHLNGQIYGVLAVPTTGNSTREVFAALRQGHEAQEPATLVDVFRRGNFQDIGRHCFNRLQEPACEINPDIRELLCRLKRITGTGILTGSGSGCFSFLSTRKQARLAAAKLAQNSSSRFWTFRC